MFDSLFELLRSQLENEFFTGGAILTLLIGALAYLRNIPSLIWSVIKRQCFLVVDITDEEPVFEWLKIFLDQHPSLKRSRLLTVSVVQKGSSNTPPPNVVSTEAASSTEITTDDETSFIFSPAPGRHLIFHNYRPILVSVSREKSEGGYGKRYLESMTLTMPGRNQSVVRSLMESVKRVAVTGISGPPPVFISVYGSWRRIIGYIHRPIDSVFLRDGQMESIIDDVLRFLNGRELYAKWGVPYHRGYLLHGIPGTGKTSTVSSLVGFFGLPLYVVNLAGFGMNDERLMNLLFDIPARSVVLLEDLDATMPNRKGQGTPGDSVSLFGLLNCLDGIITKNGLIVFMTTNYKDRLDSAILRPGRSDVDVEFSHADEVQIGKMYDHYTNGDARVSREKFVRRFSHKEFTMAEVQAELITGR